MIGTVGVRGGKEGKQSWVLSPQHGNIPARESAALPLFHQGSPLHHSVNLGAWPWQVVEEEAKKPEHKGSFFTHLVLSLNLDA